MTLPAPHLDDWKFQEIVDEAKRRIGLRCPEWTDHNVSDPGVTLIEQFAWMTELLLFRMNQVPERNYVKFLEMVGVRLAPPTPARTDLWFRLARPIEDEDGEESREVTLTAREVVAATVRTEFEEAVEFVTDADVQVVRPRLRQIIAVPAGSGGDAPGERELAAGLPPGARFFREDGAPTEPSRAARAAADARMRVVESPDGATDEDRRLAREPMFRVFSERPAQGDCLWVGFEGEVPGNLVEVSFRSLRAAGTGMDDDNPAQVWEWYNITLQQWEPLELAAPDTTRGFNANGSVQFALPYNLEPMRIGGRRAYWVRCRYTLDPEDLPSFHAARQKRMEEAARRAAAAQEARAAAADDWLTLDRQQEIEEEIIAAERPVDYEESPTIYEVSARTLGGVAPASNCVTVPQEDLGVSDGLPGQSFTLRAAPILPRGTGETLLVGPPDAAPAEMEPWVEVADFAQSGPNDPHFTLDSASGEVRFGPAVLQPDGGVRQHGRIPAKGQALVFHAYRTGGGVAGNVAEGTIRVLKTSSPWIAEVENPRRADGGKDAESLEHAKLRARQELRIRERAVTAEDFEFLARQAVKGSIARALCLPPDVGTPGTVRVRLVPALSDVPLPLPSQLRIAPRVLSAVRRYLDDRRLLTTVLDVGEPEYVFVSTDIVLEGLPEAEPGATRRRIQERLTAFIHPVTGGPDGGGWPFGRRLTVTDLYVAIQQAVGTALLRSVRLYRSTLTNPAQNLLGPEQEVTLEEGIRLEPHQTLCTRAHRVQVRPAGRIDD